MPAGPRRDPAAEGRELERLRIVTEGEPVRLERLLERGSEDAVIRSARSATRRRSARRRSSLPRSIDAAPRNAPAGRRASTPPTTDEPPPNGDRRRNALRRAPIEHAHDVVPSDAGESTTSGAFLRSRPRAPRTTSRESLAVGVRRARERVLGREVRERRRRRDARRREANVLDSAARGSGSGEEPPRRAAIIARSPSRSSAERARPLRSPSPR